MYDVGTQTVSKLSGELSSAFVEAAEANSNDEPSASASNVIENRIPFPKNNVDRKDDFDSAASSNAEEHVSVSLKLVIYDDFVNEIRNFIFFLKWKSKRMFSFRIIWV